MLKMNSENPFFLNFQNFDYKHTLVSAIEDNPMVTAYHESLQYFVESKGLLHAACIKNHDSIAFYFIDNADGFIFPD